MKHEVLINKKLNNKFIQITFKSKTPCFSFKPGQFVIIKINQDIYRCYSIFSSPKDLPIWRIFVDTTPMGAGCKYLVSLEKGDLIETTIVSGQLLYKNNKVTQKIFVATGCGLAATLPLIKECLLHNSAELVKLYWGLRNEQDVVLEELFKHLRTTHPNFSYEIVLSQPKNKFWKGKTGHVTEHVIDFIKNQFSEKIDIYLCGGTDFVADMQDALNSLNRQHLYIYSEHY